MYFFVTVYRGETIETFYNRKKNKYSKKGYKFHTVKEGESLHYISQKYGIKLSTIYNLNEKSYDYVPKVGDTLKLNRRVK